MAVKRLKDGNAAGGEIQFQTEVEMISLAVHRNLLKLWGYCMTATERLLVYPYMSNGSVASRLKGTSRSRNFLELHFFYIVVAICGQEQRNISLCSTLSNDVRVYFPRAITDMIILSFVVESSKLNDGGSNHHKLGLVSKQVQFLIKI